jgi:hypothetical protein
MNADQIQAYKVNRAKGYSIRSARDVATHTPPQDIGIDWNNAGDRGTLERDGFDILIKLVPDGGADHDYLGAWSNNPGPDAVDRVKRGNAGRNEYRYWNPPDSLASLLAYYRKAGYAKHAAWTEARAQLASMYQAAERMAKDGSSYGVVVEVEREGITLGEASVWGLDFDGSESWSEARAWVEETARGVIEEAIEEARAALGRLCQCGDSE